MRRVREMHSGNAPERAHTQGRKPQEVSDTKPAEEKEVKTPMSTVGDPLAGLFKDNEKLLVLLLIMLLSQESANTELVLALLYIII